ncbi:polymeric immunoglobulin receptor-like isoform X1 [Hoplias malabaricus]|uniref:polymeric immunoglobulin receptor-like isoform X1 n=1 Tax=Hoplias malabaricus TaxID=27720 RepID=UPI003462206C
MKIFILSLCLISGLVSCFDVIGYSRGNLIINIDRKQNEQIYICKKVSGSCKNKKYSYNENEIIYEERLSMYKNTVVMRELKPRDGGIYEIGSGDVELQVKLIIKNDACCVNTIDVTGLLNGNAVIKCDYPEEHKEKYKYLYRMNGHLIVRVVYCLPGKNYQMKKFTIEDNTHSNIFTVTITGVSNDDLGTYFCGVQTRDSIRVSSTIKKLNLHITEKVGSVTVAGFVWGNIAMKFQPVSKGKYKKFICKESQEECPEKTYTTVPNSWERKEGYSLYEDTNDESLMVFFRQLSTGTYRCGVDVSQFTEQYTEVKMELIQDPFYVMTISVSGHMWETITITCSYPLIFKTSSKFFCKEKDKQICQKHFTSDHDQTGAFTVTINSLALSDTGVYWCGAETRDKDISYMTLTTKVQISLHSESVTGSEGDTVEVRCPYETKYRQSSKHFCKDEEEEDECLTERMALHSQPLRKAERVSVNDDIMSSVFTVTITGVTPEDAGKYWCGVRTEETLMYYLSTRLQVITKEGSTTSHTTKITKYDESFSVSPSTTGDYEETHHPSFHQSTIHPSTTDLIETTIFVQQVKPAASGSSVTISVCVILLLIGGSLLIFYRRRYKNLFSTPASSPSPRAEINHYEVSPGAPRDYVEVQNPGSDRNNISHFNSSQGNRAAAAASMYSTVRRPNNECPVYASVSFHRNPGSPTYSTVTYVNEDFTEYATVNLHPRLE